MVSAARKPIRLHAYQELGVLFLQNLRRAGLFLDMGLGKTATCLRAIGPDQLPVLVVAPKRVAEHVWPTEATKWTRHLSVVVVKGSPAERQALLDTPADITVISRDRIADLNKRKMVYRTVILDELSSYKDKGSNRWKMVRKVVEKAEYVWGLTGTPSPNSYIDLWAQIYLLDKGERLGRTLGAYRLRHFTPGATLPGKHVVLDWHIREGSEVEIKDALEDLCLYVQAEGNIEIPPITYNPVAFDLPPHVRTMMRTFKRDLVVDLALIGPPDMHSVADGAQLTNRLGQLAAGFMYSDDLDGTYTWVHDAKLQAIDEIVEATHDNLLVFYAYIPEKEAILARYPHARHVDDGDAIEAWCRGEVKMLVAHPASIGHGLNLQGGGHTIVWSTLTWELELWLQGNGRLWRQGQEHPVVVHYLQAARTVDLEKWKRLTKKNYSQADLLRFLESPL